MRAVPLPVLASGCAVLAIAAAWAVRLWLIEVPAIGWRCTGAGPPSWCSLYAGLGWMLRSQTYGALTGLLAAIALFASSRATVMAAAAAGAAGLVLYNAELGAAAVLLAALRSVRL